MQGHLASTTQRESVRSYHYRDRRKAHSGGHLLEHTDGHVQFIEFLFNGQHEHHGDVGSCTEVGCVVTDHQSAVVLLCNSDALIDRFNDLSTDHVHLGMELQVEDAIADVVQGSTGILKDRFFCAR